MRAGLPGPWSENVILIAAIAAVVVIADLDVDAGYVGDYPELLQVTNIQSSSQAEDNQYQLKSCGN